MELELERVVVDNVRVAEPPKPPESNPEIIFEEESSEELNPIPNQPNNNESIITDFPVISSETDEHEQLPEAADSELNEGQNDLSDLVDLEEEAEKENKDDDDDEEEEDEDDSDEEEDDAAATYLPLGRIKKIMKICLTTEDAADVRVNDQRAVLKSKGRGKSRAKKPAVSTSTSKMLFSKEAIFLSTAAAELFIASVTQQSGKITAGTKKKTMTVEHLKRALSDEECYEFLQGCFQPSLIIGD